MTTEPETQQPDTSPVGILRTLTADELAALRLLGSGSWNWKETTVEVEEALWGKNLIKHNFSTWDSELTELGSQVLAAQQAADEKAETAIDTTTRRRVTLSEAAKIAQAISDEVIERDKAAREAEQVVTENESGTGEAQTFTELCYREIVKIRELTLKDDEYTSDLLGEAVGSPVGITMCVEARMRQIADLQAEVNLLKKQLSKLIHKSDLDEGFIDFLTAKGGK